MGTQRPTQIRPPSGGLGTSPGLQPRRPWLTLALLSLLVPPADATPTLRDLPNLPVPGANPYLSWLPVEEEPDWSYWRSRMLLEGRERRLREGAIAGGLEVDEAEPSGIREINDLPALGEDVPGFGTLAGQDSTARIRGRLLAPPSLLSPAAEPDGSLPTAYALALGAGDVVSVDGTLGDGAHGSGGSGSGDFDFYRLAATAGQLLEVTVRTPEALGNLDPILGLYDSSGTLLLANDNVPQSGFLRNLDSFLSFEVPADGELFLAVGGFNPDLSGGDLDEMFPSDPGDPSSGPGAGSEGSYVLSVGLEAPPSGDADFYRIELQAGDVLGATVLGASTFGPASFGTQDFGPARRVSLFTGDGELLVASRGPDLSGAYASASPLPGGGEASIAYVIESTGTYAVGVELPPAFDDGAYLLELGVARPALAGAPTPRKQTLFLDFRWRHRGSGDLRTAFGNRLSLAPGRLPRPLGAAGGPGRRAHPQGRRLGHREPVGGLAAAGRKRRLRRQRSPRGLRGGKFSTAWSTPTPSASRTSVA